MGRQTPKNKLAIYLIKEEFLEDKDILKNIAGLQSINLGDSGIIYFGDSFKFPPSWVNKFFGSSLGNSANKLFNSSSKAILLINVKVADDKERIFAIPFGYGWTLINPGVWEERFGLKTALNVIDPNNLRSIDKNNMSLIPKIASEQLTKDGTFADFGIDIEQDLIRSVTGKTKDEKFGAIVTGKDALHLSVEINLGNIRDFLKLCFEKFERRL